MTNDSKYNIPPPPTDNQDLNSYNWKAWFNSLYTRVGNAAFGLRGYTVATLPPATIWAGNSAPNIFSSLIYVYDESGGPTIAFCDGINWRRVQDRAIVS